MKRVGVIKRAILDKPIFRIDSIDRVFSVLEKERLVFVRPLKWSDPLENIVFNARLTKNGKPFEHAGKNNIYAQCWTSEPDSYALWQIYTKGGTGVRMATRFENLSGLSPINLGQLYVGKVQYLYKNKLDALPKKKGFIKGLSEKAISEPHIKTLLIKRKSYRYENEIRLFSVPDESMIDKYDDDLVHVRIEPKEFFTSFLFDPRLSYDVFKKHKKRLIGEFGFRDTQIKMSTLNQANRLKIDLG